MRKSARVLGLSFLALLTTVVLGVASAFMAALALGAATALIVPGTGTPNANGVKDYLSNAIDRYITPFDPSCTPTTCNPTGIDYPASFFPLGFIGNWCPGYKCDTWNKSVGTGVQTLDGQLRGLLTSTSDDVVIFGYSQGGAVVSNELRNLGDLTPAERARVSAVTIGNAYNPDGGIFTRLGFLPTIPPPLDITFGPAMPTDTGIPITSIGFQYDPVMYAPLYWGNPFTLLNALAAFETVHGYYLTPNDDNTDPIAYGYTVDQLKIVLAGSCPGPNCRVDSNGNKYYMIPAKSLPIVDLVMSAVPSSLRPIVQPFADLVSPVLKVLIDLGYDWSGDPGKERFLSPLPFNPFQNWLAVGVKLVVAAVQGIQAFIGDLSGAKSTVAPNSPNSTETTTVMRKMSLVGSSSGEEKGSAELSKNGTQAEGQGSQTGAQDQTEELQAEGGQAVVENAGVEVKQDPVEVKQDPVEVKQDPVEVKQDPVEVKQDPVEVKQDPVEVKQDPVEVKQDPVEVKQDPVEVKQDPVEVKQDPVQVKNDPAEVKKDPEDTKKDVSGGSVSLNFSPKPSTAAGTGGATGGQQEPTGAASPTGTESEKAAA